MDTFNLICYLPWFLSVITKRENFRTRSSDDEGTLTNRHFSQLLPGYQTSTLVIMFTKWPLMKDLKRNFADTPRTQKPPRDWTMINTARLGLLMTSSHVKKLEVTETELCRWACGQSLGDRVRNDDIRERLNVENITERCMRARLRWYGHVKTRDQEYVGRKSLETVPHGKR